MVSLRSNGDAMPTLTAAQQGFVLLPGRKMQAGQGIPGEPALRNLAPIVAAPRLIPPHHPTSTSHPSRGAMVPTGLQIEQLPLCVLVKILSHIRCSRTLLLVLPLVCRRWRAALLNHVYVNLSLEFAATGDRGWTRTNPITDEGLESILHGRFRRVVGLSLADCRGLSAYAVRTIAKHGLHLRSLNLSGCKVTDYSCKALAKGCPNLESLTIDDCKLVTDLGVSAIAAGCPKLREITLSGNGQVTDVALMSLGAFCPDLERVHFCSCREAWSLGLRAGSSTSPPVTNQGVLALAQGCPKLRHFDLPYWSLVNDHSVGSLGEGCVALRTVDLRHCDRLTDAGLTALFSRVPELTAIDLRRQELLTDESLHAIGNTCSSLSSLLLRECSLVTDEGAVCVAKGCPRLNRLDLGRCSSITDATLKAIGANCPALEQLDVSACTLVTNEGVTAIAQGCPRLQRLGLANCPLVSDPGLLAVAHHCSSLVAVDARATAISEAAIEWLVHQCRQLSTLNVAFCRQIKTLSGVMQLSPARMRLIHHHIARPY